MCSYIRTSSKLLFVYIFVQGIDDKTTFEMHFLFSCLFFSLFILFYIFPTVDKWQTDGQQITNQRPTNDKPTADKWQINGRQMTNQRLTKNRPTAGKWEITGWQMTHIRPINQLLTNDETTADKWQTNYWQLTHQRLTNYKPASDKLHPLRSHQSWAVNVLKHKCTK